MLRDLNIVLNFLKFRKGLWKEIKVYNRYIIVKIIIKNIILLN